MPSLFAESSIVIITGATRGYGRELVVQFAKLFSKPSCFLLIARNESLLKSLIKEMALQWPQHKFTAYVCDLSIADDTSSLCSKLYEDLKTLMGANPDGVVYSHLVMIHNAGSMGRVDLSGAQMDDANMLSASMFLNFTSMVLLNSSCLKVLDSAKDKSYVKGWLINISSLAAVMPFIHWTEYCSIKAAREMCLRVLALENRSNLRILSYAPGPMETDMTKEMRANWVRAPELEKWPQITCEHSIKVLIDYLSKDEYENGSRRDVFD